MRMPPEEGFSLVEVLVSLLILSVGIIGAASMQLTALRNNQQSRFQSTALQLASEIADHVRNLAANGISDAANPFLALDFKVSDSVAMPIELCAGIDSVCDLSRLSESNVYEIQKRMQTALPQGRIKVCRDLTPWNERSESYQWECHSNDGNGPIVVKFGWRELQNQPSVDNKEMVTPRLVMLVNA